MHCVDPNFDAYRRQESSIQSCIGHKDVRVYEARLRIAALKSWYQYFLPNTPEITFADEMLQNLLDAFTVQGPWYGLLVGILREPTCTKLVKDVEQTILCCNYVGVYRANNGADFPILTAEQNKD